MQTLTLSENTVDAVLDSLSIAGDVVIDELDKEEFQNAFLEISSQVEDDSEID